MIKKEFGMVIFTKSVHLDVVLDMVQRVSKVWFEKIELQWLKVVIRLELADLTIIICEQVLYLESILFVILWFQKL
jgi:hypothetical protein